MSFVVAIYNEEVSNVCHISKRKRLPTTISKPVFIPLSRTLIYAIEVCISQGLDEDRDRIVIFALTVRLILIPSKRSVWLYEFFRMKYI